jgi:(heptosyl)LPS beta-1,4-glucosyltransferase
MAGEKRPTLGVVAISKNEEVDMPYFLNHLLPWVDEIVIVDDASTDRTVEIARAAGPKVRVIEHPMDRELGFAGQRNVGIEASTADWLLHMDIDERVTPELAEEILQAIRDPTKNAYRYRRLNFFLGRPMRRGGWQYWNNPQLARRGKHYFRNRVHEECVVEGPPNSIGQLKGYMIHLNDINYEERLRKNIQYMQLEADKIISRGIKVRWWHLLLHPLFRALKSYFIQGGFREGNRGLILAIYTFAGTFNWWACAWDKQNAIPRQQIERDLASRWQAYANSKRP